MSLPILKRHPVADARRHECSAGSQYPTAGRLPSHGVTVTTLTPCSMLFRTTHRPQTSWVSPPDVVASPRRRHRPSPEVPRFVTLTRTQLAASRAAGQAVCRSTVISKAGPPPCGVGPDCGLVLQAASAIAAIMQIRASWGKQRKLCSLHRYIRMAGDAGVPVPHWSWPQKQLERRARMSVPAVSDTGRVTSRVPVPMGSDILTPAVGSRHGRQPTRCGGLKVANA